MNTLRLWDRIQNIDLSVDTLKKTLEAAILIFVLFVVGKLIWRML